jgi:hypothetical protein
MARASLDHGLAMDVARQDIAKRIRRVCGNLDEAEFAGLVEDMAEIEVRYRLRADWLGFPAELSGRHNPLSAA